MKDIRIEQFLLLIFISLIVSIFISYLYITFYKNRATGSQIHRSFPLIGVSITTIFICIQFSLPLSLGLLGALSIVRFRTPVKEPEEIGFIMLIIAAAICCATFKLVFLGILLIIAVIGLCLLKFGPRLISGSLDDGMLTLNLSSIEYKEKSDQILEYLQKKFPKGKIESVLENNDMSTVSFSFTNLDADQVSRLPIEIKKISENIESNIFFNRLGQI